MLEGYFASITQAGSAAAASCRHLRSAGHQRAVVGGGRALRPFPLCSASGRAVARHRLRPAVFSTARRHLIARFSGPPAPSAGRRGGDLAGRSAANVRCWSRLPHSAIASYQRPAGQPLRGDQNFMDLQAAEGSPCSSPFSFSMAYSVDADLVFDAACQSAPTQAAAARGKDQPVIDFPGEDSRGRAHGSRETLQLCRHLVAQLYPRQPQLPGPSPSVAPGPASGRVYFMKPWQGNSAARRGCW